MEFLIIIALVAMLIFGWVGWAIAREDQAIAWTFWGIGMLIVAGVLTGEALTGFRASNPFALICCFLFGLPGLLGWSIGALCGRSTRHRGDLPTEG